MSTEAPAARAPMSQEQKDKMAAGRARAAAEKKAKTALSPDIAKQIEEMRAQIEALKNVSAALPASAPVASSPGLVTTRKPEAWYEYKQKDGWKATIAKGLNRIDDPEDVRWEGELNEGVFRGDAAGALVCAIVTRVNGEIVKQEPITGGPCHKNKAQEFIREFKRLEALGAERPWDQEHYHRDKKAEMEEALQKGQIEQLKLLREVWQQTLRDRPTTAGEARS